MANESLAFVTRESIALTTSSYSISVSEIIFSIWASSREFPDLSVNFNMLAAN